MRVPRTMESPVAGLTVGSMASGSSGDPDSTSNIERTAQRLMKNEAINQPVSRNHRPRPSAATALIAIETIRKRREFMVATSVRGIHGE